MNFYQTGGTLGSDAPSYVERHADKELFAGLMDGQFCYVLTARQMGKSSLMVRTCTRLRAEGVKVATIDPTAVGTQNVTPDQWYHGLLDGLGQELDLEDELETFWRASLHLGPLHRLMKALRHVVLARLEREEPARPGARSTAPAGEEEESNNVQLVICVDEIDSVRSLPFKTDEFFAAIRECYNHRPLDPAYRRLTFCLLGVATPSDLIQDAGTTPFNVGRGIELNDFTPSEAAPLARGLQIADSPQAIGRSHKYLERILYWTEGQPYLTQKLCRVTADALRGQRAGGPPAAMPPRALVDQLCNELFFAPGATNRDDNLVFVRDRLLDEQKDRSELLHVYRKVWQGRKVKDDELDPMIKLLRLSGVARVRKRRLRERNPIYSRVFNKEWIRSNMPDAELRREREAFRRGVIWTTAGFVLLVAGLIWMLSVVTKSRDEARIASAQADFSRAQIERRSEYAGRRLHALEALSKAAKHYANTQELKDEAIASMALLDLEVVVNQSPTPFQAMPSARSQSFAWFSASDAKGNVSVYQENVTGPPKILPGTGDPVRQFQFSGDERWLAVEYQSATMNKVVVWDFKAAQQAFTVPHEVSGRAFDFSANGARLVIGRTNGTVIAYSVPTGTRESVIQNSAAEDPRQPLVLRVHPSTNLVALVSAGDQELRVLNLQSPESDPVKYYHGDLIHDVAWHPHGHSLATACENQLVYLWAVNSPKKEERTLPGHEGVALSVAFSHRGDLLASSGADHTVRIWTTATQRPFSLMYGGATFSSVQFALNDRYLEAAGDVRQSWKLIGGEYRILEHKTDPAEVLRSIGFSSDNRLLVAASNDRVMLWDSWTATLLRETLTMSPAHSAVFNSAGDKILVSHDRGLGTQCVGLRENSERPGLASGAGLPVDESFAELGHLVLATKSRRAAVAKQSQVSIFDTDRPDQRRLLDGNTRYERLAISPDGRWLAAFPATDSVVAQSAAASAIEQPLHLWDLETDTRESLASPLVSSRFFDFTGDSKWLVVGTGGTFVFYEAGTWKPEPLLLTKRREGTMDNGPLAFSRDADLLAISDSRHSIRLFRFHPGEPPGLDPIASVEAPDRSLVLSLALSPNGEMLVATTQARIIQVWNLAAIARGLRVLGLGNL